jgi:hypothetical protein
MKIDRTSLREEIALMRLCIEARFNSCGSNTELIEQTPFINAQMLVLEKLIKAEAAIQRQHIKDVDAIMKTVGDAAAGMVEAVVTEINLTDVEINKIADALASKIKSKKRRGGK